MSIGLKVVHRNCLTNAGKANNDRTGDEDTVIKHTPPPDKAGIIYLLAGDHGASNNRPYGQNGRQSLDCYCPAYYGSRSPKQGIGLHGGYGP